MENNIILILFGSICLFVFGSMSLAFQILLTLIVIDFLTDIISSIICHKLNSDGLLIGIAKKTALLLLVAVSNLIDVFLTMNVVKTLVITFLIIKEFILIVENIKTSGIPIPDQLTRFLNILNDKTGQENTNLNDSRKIEDTRKTEDDRENENLVMQQDKEDHKKINEKHC